MHIDLSAARGQEEQRDLAQSSQAALPQHRIMQSPGRSDIASAAGGRLFTFEQILVVPEHA
jgi:hypothetical protein